MQPTDRLRELWKTSTDDNFEAIALEIFAYQAKHVPVYRQYLSYLGCNPASISTYLDIPFLPIRFFKEHKVVSYDFASEATFESSGTTGQVTSKHFMPSVGAYHEVCQTGFEQMFGPTTDYCIFALLPSYLERANASLVSMIDFLISKSDTVYGGFFLDNYLRLIQGIEHARRHGKKVMLVGVTFALLQLAEQYPQTWPDVTLLETGGMKGRGKEMTREELHGTLIHQLGVKHVYSEYGMTELSSQAYTQSDGYFQPPSWMRISLRDVNDPFSLPAAGRPGGVNVVDLANVHSCSFIETMDIGKVTDNGRFEILGRFDHSDIRGCNLMVL